MLVKLGVLVIASVFAVHAHGADSTDALIVLTTAGYLAGAADGCKVVPEESNVLSSGMAIAIGGGKYGDQARAHNLFNNARPKGVADAAARRVDCAKVGDSVRQYVRSQPSK